jgi:hypothetical protein
VAFSTETIGRLYASGRNYASVIVGFIGGIGLMSASQSKGLTDSINEIFNGISMIAHGATSAWQILVVAFPVISVVMAKWASNSAKTTSQAAAVQAAIKDPNTPVPFEAKAAVLDAAISLDDVKKDQTKITVTDPILAKAVPDRNVVAVKP